MASGSRALELKILGNVDSLNKSLKDAQSAVNGAGMSIEKSFDQVKRAVTVASVAVVGFAAAYGKQAVQAASDLNETLDKSRVVFGEGAEAVERFGDAAAKAIGQSKTQAIDAAANFAIFGKSAGLAGDDLVKFSTDFTVLASDLASFNNTSPEEAITAIGAALRGESEPIRSYGVLLNEATLKQAALSLGIITTTKEALTPQQRVLAAQAEIYRQTAIQQGNFADTSAGLANQTRILQAQLATVSADIGQQLLPYVIQLANFLNEKAIPFFKQYRQEIELGVKVVVALAAGVLAVQAALKVYQAAVIAATVVTAIFNAVVAGNPIGILIVTLAAAVAAIIRAEQQTQFFTKAWEWLTNAIRTALDWLKRVANFFGADFETAAQKHQATMKRNVEVYDESRRGANQLTDSLRQGVLPALKATEDAADDAGDGLDDFDDKADDAAGGANNLAGSLKNAAQAFKELSAAQREIQSLQAGGALPSKLAPDLKEFYRSELSLISGFGGKIEGINLLPTDPFYGFGKGGNVNQAIQQRQSGSATATGGTVIINVNGTVVDPEGAARAVESVINDSNNRGGGFFTGIGGLIPE